MAYSKGKNKLIIPRAGKDAEQLELSCTIGGNRNKNKTVQQLWKTVWNFLIKLSIPLPMTQHPQS